jgi:hypothetical protein
MGPVIRPARDAAILELHELDERSGEFVPQRPLDGGHGFTAQWGSDILLVCVIGWLPEASHIEVRKDFRHV